MDNLDRKILKLLKQDSKQNFKSIGETLHMTGQAIGARVRKLEDDGIIEGYTVKLNAKKQGLLVALITLFLKDENHMRLRKFVEETEEVAEAFRISGEGCYMIKVEVADLERLNQLCDETTQFARYKVNIITDFVK